MDARDFKATLDKYIRDKFRLIHTIKPAIVTSVKGNRVNVKPLTRTKYADGTQLSCPELFDVPLFVYKGGSGRITVPVKVGDKVVVLFSDRDVSTLAEQGGVEPVDAEDLQPLSLYPFMVLPGWWSQSDDETIDPVNLLLELKQSNITIGEDFISISSDGGTITTDNGVVTTESSSSGFSMTVGGGFTLTVDPSGNISATGTLATLTVPSVIVQGVIQALGIAIGPIGAPVATLNGSSLSLTGIGIDVTGADVVVDGKSSKTHTHPYTDDGSPAVTGPPI